MPGNMSSLTVTGRVGGFIRFSTKLAHNALYNAAHTFIIKFCEETISRLPSIKVSGPNSKTLRLVIFVDFGQGIAWRNDRFWQGNATELDGRSNICNFVRKIHR